MDSAGREYILMGKHGLPYVERENYQATYVTSGSRFFLIGCPDCDAPPGLDCVSLNPRRLRNAELGRFPVRSHEARKKLARQKFPGYSMNKFEKRIAHGIRHFVAKIPSTRDV